MKSKINSRSAQFGESDEGLAIAPAWGLLGEKKGLRRYIGPKRLVIAMLLAAFAGYMWYLRNNGLLEPNLLIQFLSDHPVSGRAIFVGLYAILVIAAVPTLPLNLAAGLCWGTIQGGVMAAAGATLGATGAFLAARLLFGQPLARRFGNRVVSRLQEEFDAKGWRFVAFLRLNPVFPTGPLNYVLGLTSIGTGSYVWATMAFLLIPSLCIAWIGHEMGAFAEGGKVDDLIKTIVSVSLAVTVLVGIRYGAKYLRDAKSELR